MPVNTTISKRTKTAAKNSSPEKIPVDLTLDSKTFERLTKYKAAHSLLKEQDVIRLAVGIFLQKQGY